MGHMGRPDRTDAIGDDGAAERFQVFNRGDAHRSMGPGAADLLLKLKQAVDQRLGGRAGSRGT